MSLPPMPIDADQILADRISQYMSTQPLGFRLRWRHLEALYFADSTQRDKLKREGKHHREIGVEPPIKLDMTPDIMDVVEQLDELDTEERQQIIEEGLKLIAPLLGPFMHDHKAAQRWRDYRRTQRKGKYRNTPL